jgi:hypothetical protein
MRLPLWLKVGCTIWLLGWMPSHYGPRAGCCSRETVALLLVQVVFSVDALSRLVLGWHLIGATEYMFDPAMSLSHRILSLFHVPMPALLL